MELGQGREFNHSFADINFHKYTLHREYEGE